MLRQLLKHRMASIKKMCVNIACTHLLCALSLIMKSAISTGTLERERDQPVCYF